jgi:alpha-L-arabinofuranosidase
MHDQPQFFSNPVRKFGWLSLLFLLVNLFAQGSGFAQTGTLTINTGSPSLSIPPTLFGAFFEEINLAGEGGLYGELVRNRSFNSSTTPDFWNLVTPAIAGWQATGGAWSIDSSVSPGAYEQSGNGSDYRSTYSGAGSTAWNNYTLTLQARKLSGSEGFLIMFNVADSNNWFWWNIGGWTNTAHAIQQCVNGTKSVLTTMSGSVNTGQWYDIKVTVQGNTINCYLDNVLTQTITTGTSYAGSIGLSTWNTQAEFRNIVVTGSDSQVLYQSNFDASGGAVGGISVDTSRPLNATNTDALKLTMTSGTGSVGVANSGFFGIPLQSGSAYNLSLYASGTDAFTGPLTARLESADGSAVYAQTTFNGLTTDWQQFTATLVPTTSDTNARLVVGIDQPGTVWLDVVSLFPQATFNNHTNGLRLDLANALAAMKPAFYRYPGGNFIESYTVANAVRWKKTIGDPASRPGHLNDAWGYWSTDGYGLDEFFRQCEDMGMEPLYGINCGLMLNYNGSATNTVPLAEMGPWVQDALDLIEYANGDTNTTWGALRATNGHPAPYNLKYLEIGNENGGSYYDERYTLFYDAIKAQHPDIKLISPVWGTTPWSRPVEIRDEHYYSDPAFFINNATKYDSYSRSGPKVFVGEYAVTSGYGTYGNLSAALGEAAFMTGMERNCDVVLMASYAPLFANVNNINWHPDLIYYDNSRWFGTPAYYVQKMFANNMGSVLLPMTQDFGTNHAGSIGLSTWSTVAEFRNVVVTGSDSQILYQSDFSTSSGTTNWVVTSGTWATTGTNGTYKQSAGGTDRRTTYSAAGSTAWKDYTLTLQARKNGGNEGFLIMFNVADSNNWFWWNLGGWGNTNHGVEQCVNGSKTTIARVSGSIDTTWHDIKIAIQGSTVNCYLDNVLTQTITMPSVAPIYSVASMKESTREIILKSVNPTNSVVSTNIMLNGASAIAPTAEKTVLTSGSPSDENSFAAPTNVAPVTSTISTPSTQFALSLPAYSATILRVQTPAVAPASLSGTAGNQKATISWGSAAGAATYTVKRSTVSGGPYTDVAAGITDTSYTNTGLTNGTTYYYVVVAVNSAGETVAATQVAVTPALPPIATQELSPPETIVSGSTVSLTVKSSVPGRCYQLQRRDSLSTGNWENIGDPVTGTGDDLIFTDAYDPATPKCFYRVQLSSP